MTVGIQKLRRKVLLVEGDELVRTAVASFLEAKDCVLTVCPTASGGVKALKQEEFDLIICDLAMPNKDRSEFFGLLRSCSPAAKRVLMTSPRVVLLSTILDEAGIDAVMEKPLTPKILEDCLSQMDQGR